jgi:acyl dehydratase
MTSLTPHAGSPLYLEDLAVGQRFLSRTITVTEQEIQSFSRQFDPQSFHLDPVAARETFFGGLAASGWHTAALSMRLIVETLPLAGGLIGAGGDIRWPRPTRPGDTLQVEIEILQINSSRSRPERGSTLTLFTTRNQNGETVQTFTAKVLLARRSGTTPGAQALSATG